MKRKEQKGITLVALVITVIITLILAGVGISLITGEDGLFAKANRAATLYNEKAKSEAEQLNTLLRYMNGVYIPPTTSQQNLAPVPELVTTDLTISLDPDTNINPSTRGSGVMVTLTEKVESGYQLQYSLNGDDNFTNYTAPFEVIEYGTVITARLYDTTTNREGNSTATYTVTNIDTLVPNTFSFSQGEIGATTITITSIGTTDQTSSDSGHSNDSNIRYKFAAQTSQDKPIWSSIAEEESSNKTFDGLTSNTTYYIYMAAVDEAGNLIEANNNKIEIKTEKQEYTVTYNANQGTDAPNSDTKKEGTDLVLSIIKPIRSGYRFMGWSTSSSATSATYEAGGKYSSNSSTTLYAVWKQLGQMTDNMTLSQAKDTVASKNTTIKAPLNEGGTANQNVVIPAGFTLASDTGEYVNAGIVIEDEAGNQFVWIPCASSSAYTKTAFKGETLATSEPSSANNMDVYYQSQPTDEANSINKYHGFYFGRYEAGDKQSTANKTMRSKSTGTSNIVAVQKNYVPYNYARKTRCIVLAESLDDNYSTYAFTKLCSAYAWDTTLKYIGNESWSKGTGTDYTSIKQNYYNSDNFTYIKYTNGTQGTYTKTKNVSAGIIPTGQGDATKNIYDMGGNCSEYTTESNKSSESGAYIHVIRGGDRSSSFARCPAGYRGNTGDKIYPEAGTISETISFRVTLYLQP